MRRPKPVQPKTRPATERLSADELAALANLAVYQGSPYHKDSPNHFGEFRPRPGAISAEAALAADSEPDCTICPRKWAWRGGDVTKLLRQAICDGFVSADAERSSPPSRVWARDPDMPELVYQARRLPSGAYYAYPLTRAQAAKLPVRFA